MYTLTIFCAEQELYREVKTVEHVGPTLRHMILLSVGSVSNQMIAKMRRLGRPIPEVITIIDDISQVAGKATYNPLSGFLQMRF